eukprot:COSAG05_NODE_7322_length_827_cov_1.399725_1_plen_227_part_01
MKVKAVSLSRVLLSVSKAAGRAASHVLSLMFSHLLLPCGRATCMGQLGEAQAVLQTQSKLTSVTMLLLLTRRLPPLVRRGVGPPCRRLLGSLPVVAYPGVPGAFSEEALLEFFRGRPVDAVGASSYEAIFSGVSDGTFSKGVVPIEDSISGTFHSVYDQLLAHQELFVVGEVASVTDCCLCVVPGVARESVTKIQSIPEILKQCSGFLGGNCDGVAWLPALNSAECA